MQYKSGASQSTDAESLDVTPEAESVYAPVCNISKNTLNVNSMSLCRVEAEPTAMGEVPETGSLATSKGSASKLSITNPGLNVNKNSPTISEDGVTRQVSTGNAVEPVRITAVDGKGGFTVAVKGGQEISGEDISFDSTETDILWRTVSGLRDISASDANMIINGVSVSNTSGDVYLSTAHALYTSGYYNIPVDKQYSGKIRPELETMIYKAGQRAAGAAVAKQQASVQAAADAKVRKTGGVYYGYDGNTMEERQKSGKKLSKMQAVAVDFAQRLAGSRGITFYFYESDLDENGNRVCKDRNGKIVNAENGFYDSKDGTIHIDLNAGSYGRGSVLFTIAHELTHFIQDWSPKHYKKLCNILMKGYAAKGQSVEELVTNQQAYAKEHGRELTREEAYDEVIADSMESILADGKVMELMWDIEATDKSLADKVKKFFRNIGNLLKKTIQAYSHVKPDSEEGRMVQGMQDIYDQLQQVFAEGLYEGGDNYRKTEKNTTAEGGGRIMFASRISELTDEDILELIENCNRGEYALRTFIPVRKDTPNILLERSRIEGLKPLDNRPVIMLVEHVQQCMDDDVAAIDGKRGHALTAQNILDITKALDDPRYIFYQQDNGKYSLIVEYSIGKRNEKGMAIVDVTRDKNPDQMNGFEGGKYNILVTAYAPDSSYLKKYIRSENNRCIYDKIEDASQRSSGSLVPSLLNDSSSNPTLTQPQAVVKENDSAKSDKVKMSARKGETAEKALSHFGHTFRWSETGYLLTDGAKLDFSGRHEGASGGYRSVDHREILDVYPEDTEFDGNGAMVDFMSQGNIRIMPEGNGINLQVQPTKAQEQALSDFISRARGEVTLDIDDANGNTVVSVEYPKGTYYSKVLQDIRNYFTDGTEPVVSELAKFRFSARKGENDAAQAILEQENAQLKENITHLKELLKLQRTITNGTKFTKTSVEAAARMLKQNANAKGDTAELTKLLHSFYEHIATGEELSWESVKENAQPVVDWLQDHVNIKPQRSEYAQDILSQLHGSRIYLDDTQKAEAAHRFGSFEAYRRSMMGSVVIAKDANTSLDSLWQELSAMYPDVFNLDNKKQVIGNNCLFLFLCSRFRLQNQFDSFYTIYAVWKGGANMHLTSFLQDGQLTVALTGEIDHHCAKNYIQAISAKIEAYTPKVCILDFRDVTFMDSSGIAVVINALRNMTRIEGRLLLSGLNPQPMKVFRASGIDKLVEIKEAVI